MVVALCGQWDAAEAAHTAALLAAVVGRGRRVIVDLAGLELIDLHCPARAGPGAAVRPG